LIFVGAMFCCGVGICENLAPQLVQKAFSLGILAPQ